MLITPRYGKGQGGPIVGDACNLKSGRLSSGRIAFLDEAMSLRLLLTSMAILGIR
jgi:hypothetical protein